MVKADHAQAPWRIHYFQRHPDDDPSTIAPARTFLEACPVPVKAHLRAILTAVADAPPPRFAGGLQWRAMRDEMRGYYEVRDRYGPWLYRVFCILERSGAAVGLGGSSIVLITGMKKRNESAFSGADYRRVRWLGEEYRSRTPRSVMG